MIQFDVCIFFNWVETGKLAMFFLLVGYSTANQASLDSLDLRCNPNAAYYEAMVYQAILWVSFNWYMINKYNTYLQLVVLFSNYYSSNFLNTM